MCKRWWVPVCNILSSTLVHQSRGSKLHFSLATAITNALKIGDDKENAQALLAGILRYYSPGFNSAKDLMRMQKIRIIGCIIGGALDLDGWILMASQD